jgi:hypothetical protein
VYNVNLSVDHMVEIILKRLKTSIEQT